VEKAGTNKKRWEGENQRRVQGPDVIPGLRYYKQQSFFVVTLYKSSTLK